MIKLITVTLTTVAACTLLCGCEPFYEPLDFETSPAMIYRAKTLTDNPKLDAPPIKQKVVAWNIKYGAKRLPFWFDCWGDRVQMSRTEVEANMAGLYALINELDPDILMLEEIEVNSRRSAYFDMVQGILDNTKLNWGAYFQAWNSRYIASEGLGRMDLGNAILSKRKITSAERTKQDDRTDQSALTNAFYIHRVIGRAVIDLDGTDAAAIVVHAEAYDVDGTKQKQIKQIHAFVKNEKLPWVLGGDFNELPPTATRLKGFNDEREGAVCSSDFVQPPYTPEVMKPFYDDYTPSVTLDQYGKTEASQKPYFTHTVLGPDDANETGEKGFWNRTLDYLFVAKADKWLTGSTGVVQTAGQEVGGVGGHKMKADAMTLSDHAPVIGTWELSK
jgi:endonuclease/exonuclease/phosphatase family metal-dependent hydrolase